MTYRRTGATKLLHNATSLIFLRKILKSESLKRDAHLPGCLVPPKVAKSILEPIVNLIQRQLLVWGLDDCLEINNIREELEGNEVSVLLDYWNYWN